MNIGHRRPRAARLGVAAVVALLAVSATLAFGYLRAPVDPAERLAAAGVAATLLLACTVAVGLLLRHVAFRDRAAAKLAEQAERLRVTLASIGDAVVVTDSGGRVTSLNPVAEALTGWATSAAAGQPLESVFRIVNESTRVTVESPAARALREGVIVGLANHTILVAKDGTERPIDDSAAPIRSPAGEIIGCILVFRDITARRVAERQVATANALLRAISETTPDLIFAKDRDTRLIFANPATLAAIGMTAEQAVGKTERERYHDPAEADAIAANDLRVMATGEPEVSEEVFTGPTGTRVYLSTKSPLRDESGAVIGIVGVSRDITGRAAERAAEREARRQLDETLESISDGCVRYDREWRMVYANSAAVEQNRFSRAESIGRTLWELYPAAVGTRLEREYRRCVAERVPVEFENFYEPWARWFAIKCYPTDEGGLTAYVRDVTDRHEAEAKLRASEERFRLAADAVNGIIYEYDAAADRVERTRGLFEVLGHRPEDVPPTGEWWWEQLHPEDAARLRPREKLPTAHGEAILTEYRVRHKEGRWLHVEDRAVHIHDAAGRLVKVVGCTTDVTARRTAELELRQDKERLRLALSSARMVAWEWDFAADRLHLSETAAEVAGLPPGTAWVDGAGALSVVHPDYLARHRGVIDRAAAEAGSYVSRFRLVRPDTGAVVWIEDRGHCVGDARPAVRLAGVLRDVTAEVAAADRTALLQAAVESANDSVLITDADLDPPGPRIEYVNPAFTRMSGYEVAEVVGRTPRLLQGADTDRATLDRLRDGLRRDGQFSGETTNYRKDGTAFVVEWRVTALRDADGAVRNWVAVQRDITDRKRAEEDLRQQDRRKNEFLATLAHELRNPLAPIRNGLQVMKLARGNAQATETARAIMERQVLQMVRLIDDLLDLSRISRGKVELRRERIDLADVIGRAVETSRPLFDEKSHRLDVALPDEPIALDADPTRLAQVVANLLNNAAKYTDAGGNVHLVARRDGESAVVRVEDDGVGIPPDMLVRIFEMFTQVDRSLERSQGGLGIGLSLVKSLVEMHGGTVQASSAGVGRGSAFEVRVPAQPTSPPASFSDGLESKG